jgi:hydrogenase-4 component F
MNSNMVPMNISTLLLIPLIATLLTLLVPRRKPELLAVVAGIAVVSEFVVALKALVVGRESLQGGVMGNLLYLDAFGTIVLLIITFVGLNTALYSVGYLRAEMQKGIIGPRRVWQYWVLFHLFMFAMLFSVTAKSPILMWAGIEATTLSTVFLVSFYNKKSSLEAGWKYLVVNSVGLLIGFFGTLTMLSLATVSEGAMLSWSELMARGSTLDPLATKIAFIFILIGYGTKAGLVPMHTWLPDAHGKAPAPISALLSGVLLNTAFLAIVRYKVVVDASTGDWWSSNILLAFGVLSVVGMAFMLLSQHSYKRLLAYSSIENMGLLAVGFGFGGAGVLYSLFHMVYHALIKSALFLASGNLFLAYSSGKIKNVTGALSVLPWSGPLLFVGFFAITGMPPFGTFLSKFGILSGGVGAHPILVGILFLALSVVFVGFMLHGGKILFGSSAKATVDGYSIVKGEHGVLTVLPIVLLLGTALALSVYLPPSLHTLFIEAQGMYINQGS